MARNNEYTTKFKADISSLKSGITQANKELKKIASEYKVASSAAELTGKEQDKLKAKLDYASKSLEQQNKKLQSYKDQLKATQEYTQKLGDREQELVRKLEEARKKFGDNSTEVQKYQKELTSVQKEINSNKDQIDKLNVSINNQQAICNKTQKEINDYSNALNDLDNNSQDASGSIDDLGDGLGGMEDAVTAASVALDGIGQIVDDLTDKFEDLVINGIKATIDGLKILAENAFSSGMTFETSMSQVAATMGITNDSVDFKKLSEIAKEFGRTTKYTAAEAGEALNYLALAGYKADDSISLLPTILNLAQAGGMDLASASDMVTDAMSALGLGMEDAVAFTDQLAKASQNSNTSVSQLGNAILTIGATAKGMKGGTVELSTALGVLANSSYKGEEGGTKLRNILLSLQGPTDDAAAIMEQLGIKVYDTEGNLRSINGIFNDLKSSMSGFTTEEIDSVMNTLFNKRDVGAAKYLLDNLGDSYDELYNKILNSNDAASTMADTMNNNLQGSIFSIQSAFEGLGIAMYEKLQGPVRSVVDSITEMLRNLTNDITGESDLSQVFDTIGNSMEDFAEKLPDLINNNLPTLIQLFNGIANIISTIIDYLPTLIENVLPKLLDLINGIVEKLPDFMENTFPKLIDFIGWVIDNLPTILTILYSLKAIIIVLKTVLAGLGIAALISKLSSFLGIGASVAGVVSTISGAFASIGSALSVAGAAIVAFLGPVGLVIAAIAAIIGILVLLYNKCEPFREFIDNMIVSIKEFFSNIADTISNFNFGEFIDNVKETFSNIWNTIVEFFTNLPSTIAYWLGYLIGLTIGYGIQIIQKIHQFFLDLPKYFIDFVTNIIPKIVSFIVDIDKKIIEFIKSMIQKIKDFFVDLVNKVINFDKKIVSKIKELIDIIKNINLFEIGKNIIDGLINGIKSKWESLKKTISSFGDGIKEGFTKAFNIHSPSRWMRDFIGKNLMEGLNIGIKNNENSIFSTIDNLTKSMQDAFNIDSLKEIQLGISGATSSINSNGNANIVNNNNQSSNVSYSPVFNYNKPLNSREIYRTNKNMLQYVLNN